ncbi:MAG: protein adenylyltransferase SelO [Novosphingobium sp.]
MTASWAFDNSWVRELAGMFTPWQAEQPKAPRLVLFNHGLAERLGLPGHEAGEEQIARWYSGAEPPPGSEPAALAYAGHQFGQFNPAMGDGRALLLGEIVAPDGVRFDIQFKGSGRTPYSRGGDGMCTLSAALREYLVSEAMAALGVQTTRSLAVVATGSGIWRDQPHPAAVLTRVAASHLRVGSFEFAAAHLGRDAVARLTDYALERHFPALLDAANRPLALLEAVADAQAKLVAKWMALGFVHGVMNTDNVTISGETIDYGPCAFLDTYADAQVFSSIDAHGRYAYGQQPAVCRWNLYRLASALIEAIAEANEADTEAARVLLEDWPIRYRGYWLHEMRAKLGLAAEHEHDVDLAQGLFRLLEGQQADFTMTFRALGASLEQGFDALAEQLLEPDKLRPWFDSWLARLAEEPADPSERRAAMEQVNPLYIPRNLKLDEALAAAEAGDLAPFTALLAAVSAPYAAHDGWEPFAAIPPADGARHVTFCGT